MKRRFLFGVLGALFMGALLLGVGTSVWAAEEHDLTLIVKGGIAGGGYISDVGGLYRPNELICIEATPKEGFRFDRWELAGSGEIWGERSARTVFRMPDQDATLFAHFVPDRTADVRNLPAGISMTTLKKGEGIDAAVAVRDPSDRKLRDLLILPTVENQVAVLYLQNAGIRVRIEDGELEIAGRPSRSVYAILTVEGKTLLEEKMRKEITVRIDLTD